MGSYSRSFPADSFERVPQGQSGWYFLHGRDVISPAMGMGCGGWGGEGAFCIVPRPCKANWSLPVISRRLGQNVEADTRCMATARLESLCLPMLMWFNNTPRSLGAFLPCKPPHPTPALAKDTHCHGHRRRRWVTGGWGGGVGGGMLARCSNLRPENKTKKPHIRDIWVRDSRLHTAQKEDPTHTRQG